MIGKSCWEYFHPDEIPFARSVHGRGVQLDRAAVLKYCQIKNKWGQWIGCECVFTIVHDVLVASTSIYKRGLKSHSKSFAMFDTRSRELTLSIERAVDAPIIRQLFSSSPLDPRYHMLSYISTKFSSAPKPHFHEPRAALFLNRFTRTSTIMFATDGLSKLLGISADELNGKSFYYCIQENCLQEAVRCLESAKANDSIAYMRFWFRDPRLDDTRDRDESMSDAHSSDQDDEDGGVHLNNNHMDMDNNEQAIASDSFAPRSGGSSMQGGENGEDRASMDPGSRSSSGNSTDLDHHGPGAIFDQPATANSSNSSLPSSIAAEERRNAHQRRNFVPAQPVELEAVISCTSDGLVVILRGARPFVPQSSLHQPYRIPEPTYANGLFASPWATQPILPDPSCLNHIDTGVPGPYQADPISLHTPSSLPQPTPDFLQTIRDVAVFAWSLTGINGSLAQYGQGVPMGEALPPNGVPVWDPCYQGDQLGGDEQWRQQRQQQEHRNSNGSGYASAYSNGYDNNTNADGYGHNSSSQRPNDTLYSHPNHNSLSPRRPPINLTDTYWPNTHPHHHNTYPTTTPDHWQTAQQMKTWQGGGGVANYSQLGVVGNGLADERRQREEWARGGRG